LTNNKKESINKTGFLNTIIQDVIFIYYYYFIKNMTIMGLRDDELKVSYNP